MLIIKKILGSFLVPPGIFITALIFAGAWLLYRKNFRLGILTLAFSFFIWALSIAPISDSIMRGLESEYNIPKNVTGDVVILLGLAVCDEAPDYSGLGSPSDGYLTRIVTAVRLQKKLNIPIIVSGDGSSKYRDPEDHIVKRFLTDLEVPTDQIIIEDKSIDTLENAKFTQKICSNLNFVNPILVTSAYHMKRAVKIFGKVGLEVTPFPAGFKSCQNKQYNWSSYLPGDFKKVRIAISEYIALLFYKLAY